METALPGPYIPRHHSLETRLVVAGATGW